MPPAAPAELRTERLILRRWRSADRVPFAELNADPVVMEHFPSTLTRSQSDEMIERIEASFDNAGLGLWAVEVAATGVFIGFTGLWAIPFDAHFTPATEVGWRLGRASWGHGYAPEAAAVAVADGFERLGLTEIVSMTTHGNLKSQRVMQKIGMARDPADDFDHPNIPEGHRLRAHVLYRLTPGGTPRPD